METATGSVVQCPGCGGAGWQTRVNSFEQEYTRDCLTCSGHRVVVLPLTVVVAGYDLVSGGRLAPYYNVDGIPCDECGDTGATIEHRTGRRLACSWGCKEVRRAAAA